MRHICYSVCSEYIGHNSVMGDKFFSIDSFYMDRTLHSSNHFHHHGHVFMFNYMHKMFSLV